MAGAPARARDPRFPNLDPDVVDGYLDAPEHIDAEVIDGKLLLMPHARPLNLHVMGELTCELAKTFDRGDSPGSWVLLYRTEFHSGRGPDILIPDIAGWRSERIPHDFLSDESDASLRLVPDWCCEILSPDTL